MCLCSFPWVCLGAFHYLKENFSNAPSLDMSSPSLCMLVRLMVAQVQECVFERITLTTLDMNFTSQLHLAQEAARVSEHISGCVLLSLLIYRDVHAVFLCVSPVGVGCVLVGTADHEAASDEGLCAVFMGVNGSGQI